jgi:hypothetical protein
MPPATVVCAQDLSRQKTSEPRPSGAVRERFLDRNVNHRYLKVAAQQRVPAHKSTRAQPDLNRFITVEAQSRKLGGDGPGEAASGIAITALTPNGPV